MSNKHNEVLAEHLRENDLWHKVDQTSAFYKQFHQDEDEYRENKEREEEARRVRHEDNYLYNDR